MGGRRLRSGVVGLLVGVVTALGCVAALVTLPGGTARITTMARRGLTSLPLAAQGPVSAALGHDEPAYRVTALRAVNPVQHLRAGFSRRGVMVDAGKARLDMTLSAYGYASTLEPVGSAPPRGSANRVSYAHGALTEWYANGPLGIEQGFDVAARPTAAKGPLTLSLALSSNLTARLQHGSVLLTGRGAALRYGGLIATDARGRVLRSWLQMVKGHVLIRVDDHDATYPLRIDPFIEQAELTASDGAAYEEFGTSVAVQGNTVVVGVPYHTVKSSELEGAVYVFTMPESGWTNATQTAELTASDGKAKDWLGYSVAISGNIIVAGAPDHEVGSNEYQGAVYVFAMPTSGWASETDTSELTATDGTKFDELGWSVGASGDTVVAGAPNHAEQGAAYVFEKPATGWSAGLTQAAELTASNGVTKDRLGESVAISGNTVVAGAPHHVAETFGEQGAAYVFVMPASGWANATQTAELTASDGERQNYLGTSVAISGNTIVAGAPNHEVGSHNLQGAAYVFVMPSSGWSNMTQTAALTSSDGAFPDKFGTSVAISDNTVVVGAIEHTVGFNADQGAAYVFLMPASGWANMTQTDELTAPDGAAKDLFGRSVAVSGNTAVVGAIEHEVNSHPGQGAAYVFVAPPPSITITSPTNGATYTQGQAVTAGYSCTAPAGASITTCTSSVTNGAPLDTTTLGTHTFTVTAIDSDGITVSQSASYTVVAPNSNPTSQRPTSTQEPTGAPGPARHATNNKLEIICKSATTGTGKNKKTTQKCTTKRTSPTITITATDDAPTAVLSRGPIIYATGSATVSGKHTKLLLTLRRGIANGNYTLTLVRGHKRQHETITIN